MADHRDLARDMDLFHVEDHSPGMVFWHPQGWQLFRTVEAMMRQQYQRHGFEEVRSPVALSRALWERSRHWEKFRDGMFLVGSANPKANDKHNPDVAIEAAVEAAAYALKPMSCPAHIAIFQAHRRSYRDLPLRVMEFGLCHRNERSGTLSGCMRLRQFVQDDAHIFCRPSDVAQEVSQFLHMVQQVYHAFGYDSFSLQISLRPDQRLGDDALWDQAENLLIDAVNQQGLAYKLAPGEGAFYGPKLEISLHDHLGRSWQCGTFQVDFNMPQLFDLGFVNPSGEMEQPVMLHQAVLGSIERWIGILLEHHDGALPLWLAPTQIAVAAISDKSSAWANAIADQLRQHGLRVSQCDPDRTINKNIREVARRRVPLMAIVGEQECQRQTLSLRQLGVHDQDELSVDALMHRIRPLLDPLIDP